MAVNVQNFTTLHFLVVWLLVFFPLDNFHGRHVGAVDCSEFRKERMKRGGLQWGAVSQPLSIMFISVIESQDKDTHFANRDPSEP
jgi:hypothetical protein